MDIKLDCIKRTKESNWEIVLIVNNGSILLDKEGKIIEGPIYDGRCDYIPPFRLDLTFLMQAEQKLHDALSLKSGRIYCREPIANDPESIAVFDLLKPKIVVQTPCNECGSQDQGDDYCSKCPDYKYKQKR